MIQIGRYQIVRELAVGGMARVFLAKAAGPRGFQKTLVLKIILPHLTRDPNFVEMFLKEARVAAQFTHPNLVQIFELGEFQGTYFIAMEYIDGPNLRVLAKRAYNLGVELSPALCAKVIWYACEGLGYAHDFQDPDTAVPLGLVHRDISPENIIVSRTGTVKVVDFGIAKGGDANGQHTKTGIVKGKIAYMCPEVIRAQAIDRRADVFALGVVLYEMLSGCKPYRDSTTDVKTMQSILFEPFVPLAERQPTLPEGITRIVERALEKDREARYQDCRELQADLEAFLAECGESASPHQLARLVAEVAEPPPLPTPTGTAVPSPAQPIRVSDIIDSGQLSIDIEEAGTGTATATAAQAAEASPAAAAANTTAPIAAVPPGKRSFKWGIAAGIAGLLLLLVTGVAAVSGGDGDARDAHLPSVAVARGARVPIAPRPVPEPEARIPEVPVAPAPPVAAAVEPAGVPTVRQVEPQEVAVEPPAPAVADSGTAVPARREVELASVTLASSVPGRIRVNGKPAGTAPVRLTRYRPGRLHVELIDASGAVLKEQVLRLTPGDNGTKTLEVGEGTLEFRIRPYATVILDGKPVGETPLTLRASEGMHRIVLVNKELGKEVALNQVVKANERTIVRYILDE